MHFGVRSGGVCFYEADAGSIVDDAPNDGAYAWTPVPNNTDCIIKFEVENSRSKSSSRIFVNNEFDILPEPTLLTFAITFLIIFLRKHW